MEGENPPETSVPKPTCHVNQSKYPHFPALRGGNAPHLDSKIKIFPNLGNSASQVEVANGAVAYAGFLFLDQLQFVVVEVDAVTEDGVMSQKAKHVVDVCVVAGSWECFEGIRDFLGIFGNVGLDVERPVVVCQGPETCEQVICA